MYKRILNLSNTLEHRSLFLLGPRQTGKSTYLEHTFPNARTFNLLEADTFRELSARPELLRQRLLENDSLVIIDEIQKLPTLLDEVHLLIERNKKLRFILTGSSARKLKRGAANLLGGRALTVRMHPLVSKELDYQRVLDRLNRGSLPSVIDSPFPREDLESYIGNYLQEEIAAEAKIRSLESFSRFLEPAALTSAEQINFTSVADDVGVPPRLIREYYQILEDTLLGFELRPYQKTVKRKAVATSKFYLFDVGITNALAKRGEILEGSELYGKALEQLIVTELRAYIDYTRSPQGLTYWRSRSQLEVDVVLGDDIGIEIKGKRQISHRDIKGLCALAEEIPLRRKIIVCNESAYRKLDSGIEIYPIEHFLRELWEKGL